MYQDFTNSSQTLSCTRSPHRSPIIHLYLSKDTQKFPSHPFPVVSQTSLPSPMDSQSSLTSYSTFHALHRCHSPILYHKWSSTADFILLFYHRPPFLFFRATNYFLITFPVASTTLSLSSRALSRSCNVHRYTRLI